jgi:hypothetical protein
MTNADILKARLNAVADRVEKQIHQEAQAEWAAQRERETTARWFINISYAHQIEVQYPVEVLDRTDDTLTVRFLSTGSVSIFNHDMIRELPFDKKARRLSRTEATAHWAKPA